MPKRKDDALTDSLKELATIQNDSSSLNTNSSDSRERNSVSFENFVHRFEHWLLRDPTTRHVLDYLCKIRPHPNSRVWLHGPSFPVTANHLSNALFTTQFAQGFDFVIQVIW